MIDNPGDDLISGGSSSCTCQSKGGFRRPAKEGGLPMETIKAGGGRRQAWHPLSVFMSS